MHDVDDFIQFVDEHDHHPLLSQQPWKILVVDDDADVHGVTRLVLSDQLLLSRPLQLLSAYSAAEARSLLLLHPDVAVILLDVVMETSDAGLALVRHVREDLGMGDCRIILRTGQPGYAPELDVIQSLDINDYRTKTELTHTRLITALIAALRAYQQLHLLVENRRGLAQIVASTTELLQRQGVEVFGREVLVKLAELLGVPADGAFFIQQQRDASCDLPYPCAVAGRYQHQVAGETWHGQICEVLTEKAHRFLSDGMLLFLQGKTSEAVVAFHHPQPLGSTERQLIEVFAAMLTAAFQAVDLIEHLNEVAQRDLLTGHLNRFGFIRAISERQDLQQDGVVALLDICRFADINDALGHDVGNDVLVAVGQRLREGLGKDVVLARVDSDVFGLFGSGLNDQRLQALFAEPFRINEHVLNLEVHAGIAGPHPESMLAALERIKQASIALHRAKQLLGGACAQFDERMEEDIRWRLQGIHRLREAHEQGRLEVWYQPQIRIDTGEVCGAEALLRWMGPDGMSPVQFVPLAEYSGLIVPIGYKVLEDVCRAWFELAEAGCRLENLAVNVSVAQFRQPSFVERFVETVKRAGLPRGVLEVEITESVAMEEPERVRQQLATLRNEGLMVTLDDFGTGYSSLSYVQQLPLDRLKVDRSFVSEIQNGQGGRFARLITDMAHSLGLEVVAEGVETTEQWNFLHGSGCDLAQGYLMAKPMALADFKAWAAERLGDGAAAPRWRVA